MRRELPGLVLGRGRKLEELRRLGEGLVRGSERLLGLVEGRRRLLVGFLRALSRLVVGRVLERLVRCGELLLGALEIHTSRESISLRARKPRGALEAGELERRLAPGIAFAVALLLDALDANRPLERGVRCSQSFELEL